MKKLKLTLILCLFVIVNASALTVSPGSTMVLGSVTITENIIIESGGSLVIDGPVIMGNPGVPDEELYILIKDGGRMKSTGGSLSGLLSRKWFGIIVEATKWPSPNTSTALNLKNFTIRHARVAIEMPPYRSATEVVEHLLSRKIKVENTIFDENNANFTATYGLVFPGTTWGEFNAVNGVNSVVFKKCSFLRSTDNWAFHARRMRNLRVDQCLFDNPILSEPGSDAFGMHLHTMHEMQITNSTFRRTGMCGIILHSKNKNVLIYNNQFEIDDNSTESLIYSGIGIGYKAMVGSCTGISITHNQFTSAASLIETSAITCGPEEMPFDDGPVGYIHQGTISDNTMEGFANGILIRNNYSSAASYLDEGVPNLRIFENKINNYKIALELAGKNDKTDVFCNRFETGDVAFSIGNSPTAVQNWGLSDPNNKFVNATLDIQNLNTTPFNYYSSPVNLYPATSSTGAIFAYSTTSLQSCATDPPAKSLSEEILDTENNDVNIFPNPSSGRFTVQLKNDVSECNVLILNIQGRVVESFLATSDKHFLVDLSKEPEGIYLVQIQGDGIVMTEKLVKH